jgi:hypothetical protein
MVFGTEEGKPSEESEAVGRSDGRQNPAYYASGLQARAAARVSAAAAGRQSHELGEPANDQRLLGGPHDAEAGVRDSPQHSGAEAHAHLERCGDSAASVGVAGPDVDGSGLCGAGDVREAGVCVGKVQGAEVEGIECPGSHASSPGGVSSRMARQDAFRQGYRLRVPGRPAQGQEAVVRIHHGAEVPAAGGGESGRDQGWAEGAFRLSQLPARTGDGAGEAQGGGEDGAGDAASRGLRDDDAALRTIGHGVDARGTGEIPGAAIGPQDSPAHGEGSVRNRRLNLRIVGCKFRLKAANCFKMMVARDGVEPPTPAFSVLL